MARSKSIRILAFTAAIYTLFVFPMVLLSFNTFLGTQVATVKALSTYMVGLVGTSLGAWLFSRRRKK
jgi:hypothetical protein